MNSAALPTDVRVMNSVATLMMAAALLAFVLVGVRWFIRLPMFSVHVIHIDGDTLHNTPTSLRSHVLGRIEGNVFTMNLLQAKRAFESAPWVRRAVVRRVWPNQLAVTLEEHRAVAHWDEEDRPGRLVNSFGEVFEVNVADVEDEKLPVLAGPARASEQVLFMQRRLNEVFAPWPARVDVLKLSERGSWRAKLDTGARIELGRGADDAVLPRVQALVNTLPKLTERYQAPLLYADLRHRDGYAVRFQGIATGAAEATVRPGNAPRIH